MRPVTVTVLTVSEALKISKKNYNNDFVEDRSQAAVGDFCELIVDDMSTSL